MRVIFKISLLLICTIILSCQNSDSEQKNLEKSKSLEIIYDTLTINIKGRMGPAIKYENKYYCFFETSNPYSSRSFKYFYIISPDGTTQSKIKVPDELNRAYYDLHIRNDSIITKEYWDNRTFYLDTIKLEWIEIKEVDDLVFEDEKFYVTYLNFGEWGSTVWFKDKNTNKEYELASSAPIINKIDNLYILTNGRSIFEIKDPTKMQLCDTNNYYNVVEKDKSRYGSRFTNGTRLIFGDTTSWFDSDFYIASSFVFNDSLFHLCVDSNITYLAIIDSGKIKQLKTIGNDINIYRHHYSYRGNSFKNKKQLLKFKSKNRKQNGFIEIFDNKVKIIHINNIDSAKYLGTEKADKTFRYLSDYHIENIGNLFLQQIDSIVPSLGGYNVTPHHKMSIGTDYYPNKNNFELETPRVYKIIEDSTLTLLIDYYYTKYNGSVKVISYEWRETWENDYDLFATNNENFKIIQFQNRLKKIKEYLTTVIGNSSIKESKSNSSSMTWKTETGLTIKLSWNDFNKHRRIRMKIYKE